MSDFFTAKAVDIEGFAQLTKGKYYHVLAIHVFEDNPEDTNFLIATDLNTFQWFNSKIFQSSRVLKVGNRYVPD